MMSKYAVVKIGSSQFKVAEGDEIELAKLEGEKGKLLTLDEVLLLVDGKQVTVGRPTVAGASVKVRIIDQFKGEKIRVATYKAKSRYRRVKGFRPLLTKLKIEKIGVSKAAKRASR